jgi:hypothetical protein
MIPSFYYLSYCLGRRCQFGSPTQDDETIKNTKRLKDEQAKPNPAHRSYRQVPEASLEVGCNPGWNSIAHSGLQ